jgi:hypothetical protein
VRGEGYEAWINVKIKTVREMEREEDEKRRRMRKRRSSYRMSGKEGNEKLKMCSWRRRNGAGEGGGG